MKDRRNIGRGAAVMAMLVAAVLTSPEWMRSCRRRAGGLSGLDDPGSAKGRATRHEEGRHPGTVHRRCRHRRPILDRGVRLCRRGEAADRADPDDGGLGDQALYRRGSHEPGRGGVGGPGCDDRHLCPRNERGPLRERPGADGAEPHHPSWRPRLRRPQGQPLRRSHRGPRERLYGSRRAGRGTGADGAAGTARPLQQCRIPPVGGPRGQRVGTVLRRLRGGGDPPTAGNEGFRIPRSFRRRQARAGLCRRPAGDHAPPGGRPRRRPGCQRR